MDLTIPYLLAAHLWTDRTVGDIDIAMYIHRRRLIFV
jgi:hypothetical protein